MLNTEKVLIQSQAYGDAITSVTFASSDPSVAEVTFQDGTNAWVVGRSVGTAILTATREGYDIEDLEITVTTEDPEGPTTIPGLIVIIQGPEPV